MVSTCSRDPPENDRPTSQQDESVLQRTSGDNLLSLCCTGNACRDSPDGGPQQCESQGRRASLAALAAAAAAAALPSGRAQAEAPVLEQAREAEQQADVDLTITDRVYLDIGAPPLGPAASCHLTDHAWRLHVAAQSPPPFSGPSLIHPAGCNDACEGRQEGYVAPMSLIASKCCLEGKPYSGWSLLVNSRTMDPCMQLQLADYLPLLEFHTGRLLYAAVDNRQLSSIQYIL